MKKTIINTNSREIYEKINMLHFLPEVTIKDVEKYQINKILKNINKNEINFDLEIIGKFIIVKKINNIDFDIYFRNNNKVKKILK